LLPAELPGFTGRITRVIEKDKKSQLAGEDTEGVEQFDVVPNQNYQLITLPTSSAPEREHFYVHVNGEPTSGNPDFETDPDATGILQYRPQYTVPLLVQVADIYASNLRKQELIANDMADSYELSRPSVRREDGN